MFKGVQEYFVKMFKKNTPIPTTLILTFWSQVFFFFLPIYIFFFHFENFEPLSISVGSAIQEKSMLI